MFALVATVLCVCALSIVIGQAMWSLAGLRRLSWLAPAAGFGALLVLASAAVRLPGGGVTALGALVTAGLASLAALWGRVEGVLDGLRRGAPVAVTVLLLTLVPFVAAGFIGTVGARVNGSLAGHLVLAESLRTGQDTVRPFYTEERYPAGPHAVAAALAVLGNDVEESFTALFVAVPLLTALTALTVLAPLSLPRRTAGAALVGLPYLLAGFFVQASFREPMLALLVLGLALGVRELLCRGPWRTGAVVPFAALSAGAVTVFGLVGIVWPLAVGAACGAVELARRRVRPSAALMKAALRPAALLVGLVALGSIPELARIPNLLDGAQDGVEAGYISSQVSVFELFGIWRQGDFRFFSTGVFYAGFAVTFGLACAAYSLVWWMRRRDLTILVATAACFAVYLVVRDRTTPYSTAKGLAVLAPLTMLIVTAGLLSVVDPLRAFVERRGRRGGAAWGRAVATFVFVGAAGWSTMLGLRSAEIGPREHAQELATLRPLVKGHRTLFFGQDDHVLWELRGALVSFGAGFLPSSQVPYTARTDQPIDAGSPIDFDNFDQGNLDTFDFVVGPRTRFMSRPPPNWHAIRETRSYVLWQRRGPTPNRELLNGEGAAPGERLNCRKRERRRVAQRTGNAGVVPAPVVGGPERWRLPRPLLISDYGFAEVFGGETVTQTLLLPRGTWELSLQYSSPQRVVVGARGTSTRLPLSYERGGPYWTAGTVESPGGPVSITVSLDRAPRISAPRRSFVGGVAATRLDRGDRVVPLREACGAYVDWFTVR